MIYQIPVDQITGLAKYGLALSCTAVSDLAESDLARYAPPMYSRLCALPPEAAVTHSHLVGLNPQTRRAWRERMIANQ